MLLAVEDRRSNARAHARDRAPMAEALVEPRSFVSNASEDDARFRYKPGEFRDFWRLLGSNGSLKLNSRSRKLIPRGLGELTKLDLPTLRNSRNLRAPRTSRCI